MKRLAVLLLLVMACAGETGVTSPPNPAQQLDTYWGKSVEEVTLTDGTHCAIALSSEGGIGISCDWGER